ncbi:MAG: glycoside hydrolase family 2 [Pseudobutyrivibrio sp.]|nr:glycoside hydrolase family 2 [Pseudobutyrivibrio sp.]
MKIWILDDKHFPTGYANGLIEEKYPERRKWYINKSIINVSGYSGRKLTINVNRMLKPAIGYWEIEDFFKTMGTRMANRVLSVIAVRRGDGKLLKEEMIDLTDSLGEDGFATFTLPDGLWRIFVIFKSQTDGGNESYINMIDKVSAATQIEGVYEAHWQHYRDEFGKTILGFFSDEPQFGNINEVCYDAKLGKVKMPLPWSDELEEKLEGIYGDEFTKYLPFLFEESEEKTKEQQIRYDYMNIASQLYKENFCEPIGKWCQYHGVEYIGHVVEDNGCHSRFGMGAGHFFRSIAGQHMSGIDVIGEQVVFGAGRQSRQGMGEIGGDGEFFHYTLGKLGASFGHLDPKKKGRTMCELFGAYGWNFGVRDMKYVLDHVLSRGINELVPHAFSMADYPDQDCPPHFYAGGNNGQFPAFAHLMKYANRMCELLSDGVHVPSVAVLYDGEADWVGDNMMPMQKVVRALMESQIDFDFVPTEFLAGQNGDVITINGLEFGALYIPYTETISRELCDFIFAKGKLPVAFVGGYPSRVIRGDEKDVARLKELCENVELEAVASHVAGCGLVNIKLDKEFKDIAVYHYKKNSQIFLILNESATETFCGTVKLPAEEVACYDGFLDGYFEALSNEKGEVKLCLKPGQMAVLVEGAKANLLKREIPENALDVSDNWKVELVKPIEYPKASESLNLEKLVEISEIRPTFAGIIRYEKEIELDSKPEVCFLKAAQVYENLRVFVNEKEVGFVLTPPYEIDITDFVKQGKNRLVLEVLTTPARDQLVRQTDPFDFSYEAMEATGMTGPVELKIK